MMKDNEMLMCLIAFILGYLVSRHMGNRNGFNVGGPIAYDCDPTCPVNKVCNSSPGKSKCNFMYISKDNCNWYLENVVKLQDGSDERNCTLNRKQICEKNLRNHWMIQCKDVD